LPGFTVQELSGPIVQFSPEAEGFFMNDKHMIVRMVDKAVANAISSAHNLGAM
jgi:hypothetical protein